MPGPLLVAVAEPEARDRAVDGACRHVVRADAEPRRDARAERLQHDVRALEQPLRDRRVAFQVDDDRLLPRCERGMPGRSRRAHRIASRLLDADDPGAEAQELRRGERSRQVAREVEDEQSRERLHRRRTYHYPSSSLAQRTAAVEEKRRQILDAAVRVFAHRGFHTSRVGDIAEEAGVAHGLLYHYFDSKDAAARDGLPRELERPARPDPRRRGDRRAGRRAAPPRRADHPAHLEAPAGRRPRRRARDRPQPRDPAADRGARATDRLDSGASSSAARSAASSAPSSTPASAPRSSTAGSTPSSPAGCSAPARTETRLSRRRSGRSCGVVVDGFRTDAPVASALGAEQRAEA